MRCLIWFLGWSCACFLGLSLESGMAFDVFVPKVAPKSAPPAPPPAPVTKSVPNPGGGAGGSNAGGGSAAAAGETGASFFGVEVKGTNILFILDRSGSMMSSTADQGTRLSLLKKELIKMLDVFTAPDTSIQKGKDSRSRGKYQLLFFSDDVDCFPELICVQMQNLQKKAEAIKYINTVDGASGTSMGMAWEEAQTSIRQNGIDTVYFLSDGEPTDVSDDQLLKQIEKMQKMLNPKRVVINCISIGRDSDLLQKIARGNGGKYSVSY